MNDIKLLNEAYEQILEEKKISIKQLQKTTDKSVTKIKATKAKKKKKLNEATGFGGAEHLRPLSQDPSDPAYYLHQFPKTSLKEYQDVEKFIKLWCRHREIPTNGSLLEILKELKYDVDRSW